jgi:hypothetical protein
LGLAAATLVVAALGWALTGGLDIHFTGKFFVVSALSGLFYLARYRLMSDVRDRVDVARSSGERIEALAENTLLGNLAGVLFGVFMYFPTLVEVPIANMFLSLGMHRGPLLAYLMADPELSLQSILIISMIIGRLKAWTYVFWVALFSTVAGFIYGTW